MTLEEPFVPAEAGAGAPSHSHAITGHPAGYSGEGALQPVMGLGQADSLMLNREAQLHAAEVGEGLCLPAFLQALVCLTDRKALTGALTGPSYSVLRWLDLVTLINSKI